MPFIEMDPAVILSLIEGCENELEPENRKLDTYYRQFVCPRCGSGACRKEYDAKHAFADPNYSIARALLRCTSCSCLFNPHHISDSGQPMIVQLGDLTKTSF